MSGYNSSIVQYDERADLAIQISSLKNAVSGSCKSLESVIGQATDRVNTIQDHVIRQKMEDGIRRTEDVLNGIHGLLETKDDSSRNIQELHARRDSLRKEQDRADTAATHLKSVLGDAIYADLRVPALTLMLGVVQDIASYVEGHEDEFLLWCSKAKDSHKENAAKLRSDLEEYVQSARANARMEPHVLDGLQSRTNALKAEHARHVSTIDEMGAKHERRIYLINAVKAVCEGLNFAQREKPLFQDRNDAYSPMQLEFDTKVKGILSFTFPLKGEIHSESAFPSHECRHEFKRFSEWLHRDYGVATDFHPEGQGGPGDEALKKQVPRRSSVSGGRQ